MQVPDWHTPFTVNSVLAPASMKAGAPITRPHEVPSAQNARVLISQQFPSSHFLHWVLALAEHCINTTSSLPHEAHGAHGVDPVSDHCPVPHAVTVVWDASVSELTGDSARDDPADPSSEEAFFH